MRYLKHILAIAFFACSSANAQIITPVKWQARIEQQSDTEYLLIFNGTLEKDWHLYSQFTPKGGAAPLQLLFPNSKDNFNIIGKATESLTATKFNDVFGVDETFFIDKVQLQQQIRVTEPDNKLVQVELVYQVCKEVCVPQRTYLEFDTSKLEGKIVKSFVLVKKGTEKLPVTENPVTISGKGLWSIFFIAFLSGFAALLTPCVFPMIPMTVSFFTKQSKSKAKGIRNAIMYGISIILIYLFLGSVITLLFGSDALNALSTNVWFNLAFFVLLVVFALSFLGAFEIVLPNSWANKVDRQADRGGILGILFMALALAIVSFSCTGPIVGTLLVEAASKGGLAPIVGMLGFSSALALPFMLFALFPGWLNSLPKSGGWLHTVKVCLGFLELALAFKFLSNADLVLQLHWLERELFLAVWIAIFGTFVLYLFGKIRLPHDTVDEITVGRLSLGLLVLSFTIYLIPGLWGAPLKLISGFPPPLTYAESPKGVGGSAEAKTAVVLPSGAELGPHGITAFTDYDKGIAYAKSINKPILLDFTGYACVNCRKIEDNVWSDPSILSILKNDVVLISLHVDDKRTLPENQQYISEETGKSIETVGNKWSDFQIARYKANAQPFYVILDSDGNDLNQPAGYVPDIKEYKEWLQTGISK
ncbi:cytochrome c biogenesis protein CcdA [Flavobacterium sp. XS2P39]|uniref:protein-disulfide reductase DsbD family protein n=1 Tax=Flavobacterium sp. XS2P39 TaxID=3401725 RepID=UPI003AAFB77F